MFLPQYHNCELNSVWWGEGFTEWDNVKTASPLFDGHRQPRVPLTDYYDLLDDGELESQALMARKFGIEAFSIYHYWSKGKMPLRKPLDLILANPSLNINFSLTWGNHSWTRSWQNRAGALDVLMEQEYEIEEDDRILHFNFLCKAMLDKRYTLVNNRPLFQIYKPETIPNLEDWIRLFRQHAYNTFGLNPWISGMVNTSPLESSAFLFDSLTSFQPTMALYGKESLFDSAIKVDTSFLGYLIRSPKNPFKKLMYKIQDSLPDRYKSKDYEEVWERLIRQYSISSVSSPIPLFPMAFTDFDNTPRYRGRALIMKNSSSECFESGLRRLAQVAQSSDVEEKLIFINAWNEWGEGMYLQPDIDCDFSLLDAVKASLKDK